MCCPPLSAPLPFCVRSPARLNSVCDEGAAALARSLVTNSSLTSLDLGCARGLRRAGVAVVAARAERGRAVHDALRCAALLSPAHDVLRCAPCARLPPPRRQLQPFWRRGRVCAGQVPRAERLAHAPRSRVRARAAALRSDQCPDGCRVALPAPFVCSNFSPTLCAKPAPPSPLWPPLQEPGSRAERRGHVCAPRSVGGTRAPRAVGKRHLGRGVRLRSSARRGLEVARARGPRGGSRGCECAATAAGAARAEARPPSAGRAPRGRACA